MRSKTTYITKNAQATKKLGEQIAKELKGGTLIALYGNLGSGKTTFVQGLAKGLGIKRRIISPTFIIVRSYERAKNNFYHIDLYRIDSDSNLSNIGIKEIINDEDNIVALEWAEKIKDFLPEDRIDIKFKYQEGDKREVAIVNYGSGK